MNGVACAWPHCAARASSPIASGSPRRRNASSDQDQPAADKQHERDRQREARRRVRDRGAAPSRPAARRVRIGVRPAARQQRRRRRRQRGMRGLERGVAGKERGWRDGPDVGAVPALGRERLVWSETSVSRRRTTAGRGPLRARPGGPAERFAGTLGDCATPRRLLRRAVLRVRRPGRRVARRRLRRDARAPRRRRRPRRAADNGAIREIVNERSGSLDTASTVGSTVGGAPVLPILVGLVAIVCAFRSRWLHRRLRRLRAVDRVGDLPGHVARAPAPAPVRPRLEDLPANASYPSGHTAASIAVYAGLVLPARLRRRQPHRARRRLGGGDRAAGLRRDVADVPRHAPPARRRRRPRSSASAR